jgi:ribonuclease R
MEGPMEGPVAGPVEGPARGCWADGVFHLRAACHHRRMQGRISCHPRGFGFVTSIDEVGKDGSPASAFVPPPDMNGLLDGDLVTCDVDEANGKRTARHVRLVERTRTRLFGDVVTRGGARALRVDPLVANTSWSLDPGDVDPALLVEGAQVLARVERAGAVALRVVAGVDAELERLIVRHDLAGEHAPDIVAAAAQAGAPSIEGRRELRGLVTVTIDGPSTMDIDDALLAFPPDEEGALRVVVAIADVSSVVEAGGVLDADARARGTSVYLPGRTLPMLPRVLSEDQLSLLEGRDRPALTAELRIDVEGRVTSVDVHEAMIRSTARLTYDDVARFLEHDDRSAVPAATHQTLRLLRAAAARLSQSRSERGGKDVERDEISVRLDEQGAPTGLELRRTDVAHVIVERLMVAANEAVARFLVERGLPGVYRVHDPPTLERTKALADAAQALGVVAGFSLHAPLSPRALAAFDKQVRGTKHEAAVESALRRLLGPARYTTMPSMHFGLAAALYVHFTSPIRRYADLAVHRILRRWLRGERDIKQRDEALEEMCAALNDKAHRAARAESERERVLIARLWAQRLGERTAGVVVGNKPQGALVQIEGALALLPGDERALGEALEVVIAHVDEELGRIDVALAG